MQRMRELWIGFKNFAIILSFIVNIVLLVIVVALLVLIFQIKNDVAEPLIDGLHSNFVGLNEARIVADIEVDDEIPISFTLPLEQNTNVVLSSDVVLNNVPAVFTIDGGGGTITGSVAITLPRDTILPVTLDLDVPVDQQIPINLTVPVNIALENTQLSEPFTNLRDLVDPYVRMLDNLPDDWDETTDFAFNTVRGRTDLLEETEGSRNPWPGFEGTPLPTLSDGSPGIQPTPTFTPFPTITPTPAQ
ncbi:MAG: hypothetical protein L0154_25480 [Chloroflexi bacterium]|nr:hypothetical protein [Chloroflexota bacterium]